MAHSKSDWQVWRMSEVGGAVSAIRSAPPAPAPGQPLRAVLVDPDEMARRHLRQALDAMLDVAVVAEASGAEPARQAVSRERPDLLFSEVGLPEGSGVALARELGAAVRGGVVFVTDRADLALQAFDVHALDYLVKPVSPDRLLDAVAHVRRLLVRDRREPEALERLRTLLDQRDAERQRRARLLIRHADRAFFLRTEAVDWLEVTGKLVKVHAGRQVHVQREALARIERHLDPDQFVRISRSAIVNVDRIREIQPWFNGEHLVILDDDSQVPSSRHFRANLRRLLGRGDEP